MSIADAIKAAQVKKTCFYKWRPLAELKLVNEHDYISLEATDADPVTLLLSCKAVMLEDGNSKTVDDKKKAGDLIKYKVMCKQVFKQF